MNVHVPATEIARYRAIWISDIHLGTSRAQAEELLEFFRCTQSDFLYLVGDIVDNWALKKTWFWHQSHNDVIQKILRKARKGTRVVYIPGNHDEQFRDFAAARFGRLVVKMNDIHIGLDGTRYLVWGTLNNWAEGTTVLPTIDKGKRFPARRLGNYRFAHLEAIRKTVFGG